MIRCCFRSSRHAFTLIELLVTISIIALLTGILLPALGMALDAARAAVCLSNQRQTTVALLLYTEDHDGSFVPNLQLHSDPAAPGGTRAVWWFGEEIGGIHSSGTPDRPLDKTQSPLARYFGGDILQGLACPAFPRDHPRFFAKFSVSSAHFGYNDGIAPLHYTGLPPKRIEDVAQPSRTFAFADALHLDGLVQKNGEPAFYEPHYAGHSRGSVYGGFGHFRHAGAANVARLDGHAAALAPPVVPAHVIAGSAVADLDDTWGEGSIYGFKSTPW